MAKVIRQTADGGLYYSGGRFHFVTDETAKAQLLREHAYLEQGDDPLRRLAGVAYSALKKAKATPQAVASALSDELARDSLVRSVIVAPVGSGIRESLVTPTQAQRAYALQVTARLKSNAEITFTLEVPLGS